MGGQAKFKGFLAASRIGPIGKPPKIPKLPAYKESMYFNPDNFGEDKKANKKVQKMLDQVRGFKLVIKIPHTFYWTCQLGLR